MPLHTFERRAGTIRGVAFSPDGKRGLAASEDGSVAYYDLVEKKELFAWEAHVTDLTSHVLGVSFLDGGRRALTLSDDKTLKIWDLATRPDGRTGFIDKIDLASSADYPTAAAVAPDGRTIAVGTARGVVLRFELVSQK